MSTIRVQESDTFDYLVSRFAAVPLLTLFLSSGLVGYLQLFVDDKCAGATPFRPPPVSKCSREFCVRTAVPARKENLPIPFGHHESKLAG